MGRTVQKTTITTFRHELYQEDILTFDWSSVPKYATIKMEVPGGEDWSHCDVDTYDYPLIVSWVETEEVEF